jgi:nicotinate (nicotinamide) nucleotide adenylyltransferase
LPRTDSVSFALFGGSFNPVHSGHVEVIRQLSELPGIDQVLVIPAGQSPFKRDAQMLPADLRYRMVRDSIGGMERVAVLDWELRRPPPSYTVDTVTALRQSYPAAQLWLAMGSDVFAGFAGWHRAADLLDLAGLLVFPRAEGPGSEGARPTPGADALPPGWKDRAHPDPAGNLADAEGRCLVRFAPLRVPPIAASRILQERNLAQVPPQARAALSAYWGDGTPSAAR